MALSGTGVFQNDDALDFLEELADEPTLATLNEAFAEAASAAPSDYLDVGAGASAIAAAAVLLAVSSTARVQRPLRARTIATLRKGLARQPPARRAALFDLARSAISRATGASSELADQWSELAPKRTWARTVNLIDAKLAQHHAALTIRLAKRRPKGAPREAFFDPEEGQWKVEPRDSRGRDHGTARWYRPDGTLEATQAYEHGVMTGPSTRHHESGELAFRGTYERGAMHGTTTYFRSMKPTSEVAFDALDATIVRVVCDWDHGALLTTCWFDAKGNLVTPEGERWPARPRGVPKEATFNATESWIFGPSTGEPLKRHGTWRFWDRVGKLVKTVRYREGVPVR